MNVLRIIGRIILFFLMIPMVLQLALAVMGLIASFSQKPEAISRMLGRCVGTLLILMLFVWLFKKLGTKDSSDKT